MQTIKLKNDIEIPVLGLGTWQAEGSECEEAVKSALKAGYTHIDTAQMYENEDQVGKGIMGYDRSKLFITTKVFGEDMTENDVISTCNASLKKLGTDYVDLFLIHWPLSEEFVMNSLKAMKQLEKQGKVKACGVSNFTIKHFEKYLKAADELRLKIVNNQVEYHPGLNQQELLEYCKSKGISVTAYSPLVRGKAGKYGLLEDIGKKHGKSPEQVSLKWLLQKGLIVIPKSTNEKHIRENMNVFDFELSNEEIGKIDALGSDDRLIDPEWGDFD